MTWTNIVGTAATFFSAVTFLPQVIKMWKTRSAKDLSSFTLFFLFLNASLWLTYGILLLDLPIMMTNGIVLFLISCMIYFKARFD